jgi:hypothetical protein
MAFINSNRARALFIVIILLASIIVPLGGGRAAARATASSSPAYLTGVEGYGSALYKSADGGVGCRKASVVENQQIVQRDLQQELKNIDVMRTEATTGLKIVLRATPALEQNAKAKAAFLKAAEQWEQRVRTQVTVVVDVDFGETWFGQEFPDDVVGMTNPQMLIIEGEYLEVLEHMLDRVSTGQEQGLYFKLPLGPVPTSIGDTLNVLATSANFRAVGMIDATATPPAEPVIWGPPPAIGLSSSVVYDFDPTDGIDADKADFESVASHELGHVLGFETAVGQVELNPDCVPGVTIWDLFRLRPGASTGAFSTAERVLSSGGAQVFFNGVDQWQLSTGRPDRTGGDGQQPSHWKDDEELGVRLGVMDPTISVGRRQSVTLKDLNTLDLIGFSLFPVGDTKPVLSTLKADINGDVLTLEVFGTDPDGDVVKARLSFLDHKDHLVGGTVPFEVDAGVPSRVVCRVDASGMGASPAAVRAGLTLVDTKGNESATVFADFTQGDKGGPKVSSAVYKRGKLVIKGKRLGPQPEVEVNGELILSPFGTSFSTKKVEVEGTTTELNIRTGDNRVRVISGGLRSNIVVLEN